MVVLTGMFEAARIGLSFARIAGFSIVIGAAIGLAAATINYFVRGTHVLFAFSLLAPYAAFFLADHAEASGVLAVVIAGFVASWRLHYIAPESRVELYSSWEQLAFMLNARAGLRAAAVCSLHDVQRDPDMVSERSGQLVARLIPI